MKLVMSRNSSQFGGIFRRFREMAAYCEGRVEMVGVLPIANHGVRVSGPVRTYVYPRSMIDREIEQARTVDEVIAGAGALIEALAADLERERPDALLVSDTGLRAFCVLVAARQLGVPATTVVAGLSTIEELHDKREATPWTTLIERFCLQRSDLLVFPSGFAAARAAAAHPDIAPHEVVRNGVPELFTRWPRGDQPPRRRVGGIMRLAAHKNPAAFIEICARLLAHGYEAEVVASLEPDPTNEVHAFPSFVRVREHMIEAEQLARFYASQRVMLSPSRFETFGNVPMEAVATGVPAIVTEAMGVAERFRELGLDHLIVGVDDIEAAVDRALHAAPIPESLRAHIAATQSWAHSCERLLELAHAPRGRG